ncbi:MAG: hypothetical protein BWX66_02057 [Deltaproteobacteria bacterium ADurb.Bin058]|nr:MAG: hypothetical protein BWX66_02057 [Deltaproteobacteria bacterium ADurb.Bin058]
MSRTAIPTSPVTTQMPAAASWRSYYACAHVLLAAATVVRAIPACRLLTSWKRQSACPTVRRIRSVRTLVYVTMEAFAKRYVQPTQIVQRANTVVPRACVTLSPIATATGVTIHPGSTTVTKNSIIVLRTPVPPVRVMVLLMPPVVHVTSKITCVIAMRVTSGTAPQVSA